MSELTATVDVSVLERIIPEFLEYSKRTLREQVVTSAGWICVNAQKMTPAVDVQRIDTELEVIVTPKLSTRGANKGLPLKSGKKNVTVPEMSYAMMIAIARLHPNSKYSLSTGNRWPVAMPNTSGKQAFLDFMAAVAERMVSGRHSSTHFLQHGWAPAIRKAFDSPDFQHSKKYRSANSAMADSVNRLNTMDSSELGMMTIDLVGDDVVVTAENDVGENVGDSNDVLARKHREALILFGTVAAQRAVDQEAVSVNTELERRISEGVVPFNKMLS
jgi:hypothetical protein